MYSKELILNLRKIEDHKYMIKSITLILLSSKSTQTKQKHVTFLINKLKKKINNMAHKF